jgi:hypothetical protein
MLHKAVMEELLVNDVFDGFVLAADCDGKVDIVSREESQVYVEIVS